MTARIAAHVPTMIRALGTAVVAPKLPEASRALIQATIRVSECVQYKYTRSSCHNTYWSACLCSGVFFKHPKYFFRSY